ncbi:hypothetical protein NPIL_342971 [Nephila pilipes]|uniref:Uncharacterized protein n=1 Tax=Nephila pilipes TaxID=299642 RepID=A0A8X6TV74_NEPPI|nr:hypothetical protein NPIL_342971 [Nephila pilipes]
MSNGFVFFIKVIEASIKQKCNEYEGSSFCIQSFILFVTFCCDNRQISASLEPCGFCFNTRFSNIAIKI